MAGAPLSHDQLVGLIYDSVEVPGGWNGVLEQFLGYFGGDKANMFVLGEAGGVVENYAGGFDPDGHLPYHDQYQHLDPRFEIVQRAPGQIFSDVEVIDQAQYLKSTIYNEWLGPGDIRYSLFLMLPVGKDLSAAQAIMRPHSADPFGADEKRRMARLLPHLQRALRLRQVLGQGRAHSHDLQQALDLSPLPVAVLDSSGRLLCANTRARPMLEPGFGLQLVQGRLCAVRPAEDKALSAAFAAATKLAEPATRLRPAEATVPPVVEVTRTDEHRVCLVLLPLRPHHGLRDRGDKQARVLLVLHDPKSVLRLNPDLIARVHGLTPAEAQLTAALAEGMSTEDFAIARGISVQTVRTHLKRVLEKTQTRRQADLVRVILAGTAMHVHGGR